MANKDNSLSHLKIGNDEFPDLDRLFDTQDALQRYIAEKKNFHWDPKNTTLLGLAHYCLDHKHALDDEFGELMDAIGGINDGIGSAVWKWWKDEHTKGEELTLDDLSKEDLLELKFEYVDLLHFVLNIGLLLRMTGSEVMNMYLAKNAENIDRQERGY